MSETERTVSDGKKVFHKKDVAEVDNTVKLNRDLSQAKETAERVEQKEKSVKRSERGRFVKKSCNRKEETVAVKRGRRAIEDSDDSDATQVKKRRTQKGTSWATRTGVTPPQTPAKRGSFGNTASVSAVPAVSQQTSSPKSPNNAVHLDTSMDVTPSSGNPSSKSIVPGSSLTPSANNQIQLYSLTKLVEYPKKLCNEPALKSHYDNDQTDHIAEPAPENNDRPIRTRRAPNRFGLGLSHYL